MAKRTPDLLLRALPGTRTVRHSGCKVVAEVTFDPLDGRFQRIEVGIGTLRKVSAEWSTYAATPRDLGA